MTPEEAILTYGSAWTETDETKRAAFLEQCWAPDGVFHDPQARVVGREALSKHIGEFQKTFAGHRIDATTGIDGHATYARFGWTMFGPDGSALLEGIDFCELDDEGRVKLIVGFWGPWPEVPK